MGKCPKCDNLLTFVNLQPIKASTWNAVSYCCPFCFTTISVGIDPVALKTDTVNETVKALLEHLKR